MGKDLSYRVTLNSYKSLHSVDILDFPRHLDAYLDGEVMTIRELISRMKTSLEENNTDEFLIYSAVYRYVYDSESKDYTTVTINYC